MTSCNFLEHHQQDPPVANDRRSWALMLEKERQQYHRMKEKLEPKMIENINNYRSD